MTGPKITPELMATPDQPIIFVLRFSEVMSLKYALLTGITDDVKIPPKIRAIYSIVKDVARPVSNCIITKPISPQMIIVFLPYLSDSFPQTTTNSN